MRINLYKQRMESRINDRHVFPDSGPPYEIHFDETLSCRKKFHIVTDREDLPCYVSNRVMDVIAWLAHRGQHQYTIRGEGLELFCSVIEGDKNKRT